MQKKYVLVGSGGRCPMFLDPIAGLYRENSKLLAFCDPSTIRMQYHRDRLEKEHGFTDPIAFYAPEDFDRMLSEQQPDTLLVCSVDATHADYIVRGVRFGCDVIVEKPIAVSVDQCAAIQLAAKETGKNIRVSFNYRWSPGVSKVRELIEKGTIGRISHVDFEYFLDTSHGADYFRRWHSQMQKSGGLLVHKSTHHFDLINWWINSIPEKIYALGRLAFYGKENAIQRGDEKLTRYERYLDPSSVGDPFRLDLLADGPNVLYHEAEKDSGYIRDQNVFREGIDIYDTMSLVGEFRSGVFLNYSLVAYSPYEGFRVSFTGERGRMEYQEVHGSHLIMGQSDKELAAAQSKLPEGMQHHTLRVMPHFQPGYEVPIETAEGGHGGGDPLIQEQMFGPNPPKDALGRSAGWEQGIASAMLGICANRSIETGHPVRLSEMLEIKPECVHLSDLI